MVYSELVKKACDILFDAHRDDRDKGGYPYVFHPFYLATRMEDEDSACAALLHDVVEDHGERFSFADLEEAGFSEKTLSALKALTHPKGEPYMDYIHRVAKDPIAVRVKLADLAHNMDTARLNGERPRKYEIYLEARAFLQDVLKEQ